MLTLIKKNIFSLETESLIVPCNLTGSMSNPTSRQFLALYPLAAHYHKLQAYHHCLTLGKPSVLAYTPIHSKVPSWVFFLPVHTHARDPVKLDTLILGLANTKTQLLRFKLKSIAIPHIGLNSIPFPQVRNLITQWEQDPDLTHLQIVLTEPLPRKGSYTVQLRPYL